MPSQSKCKHLEKNKKIIVSLFYQLTCILMEKTGKYQSLLNTRLLKGLLSLGFKGYFTQTGWDKAYLQKASIDADSQPIPWLTYSFLDFLTGRLHQEMKIFEYGLGNSTLYYAKHVGQVTAVEHDEVWFNKIKAQVPQNVTLIYQSLNGENYSETILQQAGRFDIIIVDGRNRVKCCKLAIEKLSDSGIIILDDAERAEYQEVFSFFVTKGFKHIPFSGIAIGAIHRKITAVFYRENNCLHI